MILAVFLVVLAWMAVTIVVKPDTTRTIANVPVDYTYESAAYTSRGLSIINAPEKTVTLKLSGDGYTIGGMTAADFVVYPDWSSVRDSGEKTLRLRVRAISGGVNNVNVSIEGTDNTVAVEFDVVEKKTLPVQIKTNYLRVADGYILYDTAVSKETVTLLLAQPGAQQDQELHRRGCLRGAADRDCHPEYPPAVLHPGGSEVEL